MFFQILHSIDLLPIASLHPIAMEIYLVKNMAQLKSVEEFRNFQNMGCIGNYLMVFDFQFPDMMRTVDESKTGRELTAKLRDAVKRNFG